MLVTAHVSFSAGEAAAIVAMVRAAGVRCHLAGRHFAMQNLDLLVAMGGLKLQVAAGDVRTAVELIGFSLPEADGIGLEAESVAFRRVFWTLGLLGLVLSFMAYTPFPIWTRARRWIPAVEIAHAAR